MKLGLVITPLLLVSTAYAQAPGDYEGGDVAPPGMTPVAAPQAPLPERPRRWSVGLGVGSITLAPHHTPDVETQFDVGQLALRYRITRHIELELALSGGDEHQEGRN